MNPVVWFVRLAQRRNEIAVDKGQINRVNVKHILGDHDSAVEGTEVCVKFGSRRYRAKIIDLLEWQPPKKRRRKSKDTAFHRFTHFLTEAREVLLPSDSKVVTICEIFFPSSDKDTIRSL